MYTTTEARESHCNFRGTKQETSKLLQAAHLPSCLGFSPGVSTRVGYVWRAWGQGGGGGGEREREGGRGAAQREHTETKTGTCRRRAAASLQGSFLSFWSGEQPRRKLFAPPRSRWRLRRTQLLDFFLYIYFYVCFFTSVYFLHLLSQRAQLLNNCVKKK